ncbi:MAG: hypothetical protein JNM57_14280 [Cyclobacteriaceae bacterium]|nr:hypothetical protein [Cyclobacteriaceae bacterium]
MKTKEYLKELSLTILGVLIALLIDNYREDVRDEKIVRSYLDIVAEDLNFDIINLNKQLKQDTTYAKDLSYLSDVLTSNQDLPYLKYSLASWTKQNAVPQRKLSTWDSLDYYTRSLYSNHEYTIRKIGFSTIVNSGLSHQIEQDLLKKITIYYTTDSDNLDFVTAIDERCHWLGIEFLNKYQGSFKDIILTDNFNVTHLRNEASGRYSTTLTEMRVKKMTIEKAKELLTSIENY